MTSYWLPVKCHISTPHQNWATGQVLDHAPCSCKALQQFSAHANLGANHVLGRHFFQLGTWALFVKTDGHGYGVIFLKMAVTRHNFKYVFLLISMLQIQ